PQGVPCAGGQRCCPRGSRCSADGQSCIVSPGTGGSQVAARAVTCPDGQSECPDNATCCVTPSGTWGCCPMPQVTPPCCHPLSQGGDPALTVPLSPAGDVRCDEVTSCPDGNTCCRLSSGAWGCCPLEEAVCCPDHVHCCPQGYTCDPTGGTCLQAGGGRLPWLRKTPALARGGGDVQCDELTSCPQGTTCCRLGSGAWGCCPLEQAVCCTDHVHCCPRGYTCNVAAQSCEKLLIPPRLLWAPRPPTPPPAPLRVPASAGGATVPCACRGGQRCCRARGGAWGCCP
ncbi:GRN protein, partial [Syrrhaptes paradoxus]|nr:GRN protein [Syrrhaptes paradoxus]